MSDVIHTEDEWMRFVLICKPEQSGKTFIMIQNIINDLKEPIEGMRTINIILCDNNLLLTKQTTERVRKDLKEFEVNGELYLEFSSHKRTIYHDALQVIGAVATTSIQNVLCCTNGIRIDDIYTIINKLNEGELTRGKFFFKIWLDEADKFTGYIDSTLKPLVDRYMNIRVNCITATPKKLFDTYKYMNVLPIENTTISDYHGWTDNDIRLVDMSDVSTSEFTKYVLQNMGSEFIQPGTKWFIPAEHKKITHIAVKDVCIEQGFAVFIVNGEGLKLFLPDKQIFPYKKDDELNTKIKEIYTEHSLHRFPLAITGNICIGRGISILSDDFMIDFGILSSCRNQQEASQNSGRLKGNIKHWPSYKPPVVFTTEKFDTVAKEWEKKSRNLAELAFRKEEAGESTVITKTEFKTLGENYEYKIEPELFDSFAKAKKFLMTKCRDMKQKPRESKKDAIHEVNGYKLTSKLLRPGQTVVDLCENDRITFVKAHEIAASRNISSTDKGSRYLILPIYESLDTAANKEKYQVRYISFEE